MNQQRVLTDPTEPRPRGMLTLEHRSSVNGDFVIRVRPRLSQRIREFEESLLHHFVIIITPCVTCDPTSGSPMLGITPRVLLTAQATMNTVVEIAISHANDRLGTWQQFGRIDAFILIICQIVHFPLLAVRQPLLHLGDVIGLLGRRDPDQCKTQLFTELIHRRRTLAGG